MNFKQLTIALVAAVLILPVANLANAAETNQGTVQKKPAKKMPFYVPPRRGAPTSRVGGGTRGAADTLPKVLVLAPEHTGMTLSAQPTLYWYLSKPASNKIEITISSDANIEPVLEVTLSGVKQAGVQSISLAKHGVKLKKGVEYRWFVALIPNETARSNDVLAGGTIMYTDKGADLSSKLSSSRTAEERATALAQNGIWYDAIDTLSAEINKHGSTELKQQRSALLAQVGLNEIK